MIGKVAAAWRAQPELRNPAMLDELMRLWVESEATRLTGERLRQQLVSGQPGPEGSAMKLALARLTQAISGLEMQLHGEAGLRYDDWTLRRPEIGRLHRTRARIPIPARQGQLDRGWNLGDSTQRNRRTGARFATRTPRGQGHCLEGPAPMTTANLLYTDTEDALRDTCPAAVRRALQARSGRHPLRPAPMWTSPASGKRSPPNSDSPDCWCPSRSAGQARAPARRPWSWRRSGARSRQFRFLSSAVLATVALLKTGETQTLRSLADGSTTGALTIPLSTPPGAYTATVPGSVRRA